MQASVFPYPHGCKHNGKVVSAVIHHILGLLHQTGLAADLSSDLKRTDRRVQEACWGPLALHGGASTPAKTKQ